MCELPQPLKEHLYALAHQYRDIFSTVAVENYGVQINDLTVEQFNEVNATMSSYWAQFLFDKFSE